MSHVTTMLKSDGLVFEKVLLSEDNGAGLRFLRPREMVQDLDKLLPYMLQFNLLVVPEKM